MNEAREAIRAARVLIDSGLWARSVSDAYYAMLYAARAALSEEDSYAKTHRGAWDLFWQTFAATGRFDEELAAEARQTQELTGPTTSHTIAVRRALRATQEAMCLARTPVAR